MLLKKIKSKLGSTYNSIRIFFYNQKQKRINITKSARLDCKSKVIAYQNSFISVGQKTYLRSKSVGYHAGMPFSTTLFADGGGKIIIGSQCRLNGVYVHSSGSQIIIGDNCVIASGVNIIDSNGHIVESLDRTVGRDIPKPIIIGNNVWIGLNSIILKGTIIGDNSIVAAASVVSGEFGANTIIMGNPAKEVRSININI